jgi:antitoxin (DNA-binding transcriptional repressor) of toxin-antitoxin stability system
MTLYVGLRNYSDIKTGLRVRKGETVEIADAGHLVGDVVATATGQVSASCLTEPEPDIDIDLGADDLAQKPNRKRTARLGNV